MNWIISKKKDDFIGKRSLKTISELENRKQLVGILTDDPKQIIPEGAHAVEEKNTNPPVRMLGHITSSYFSPNCNRSIALALIKGGRSKIGKRLFFPLLNKKVISGKIVEPIFFDPKGDRLDGV